MISNYIYRVDSKASLPADRAYAFYSCLLSMLPEEYTDELHESKETPVSQCLYREGAETFWRINLLGLTSEEAFSPVLDGLKTLPLNIGDVSLELVNRVSYTAEELINTARSIEASRFFSLRILSPAAFKQSGRYTVLPDKALILQSLLNKWNVVFPSVPLEDEDAARMLLDGLRISDYDLHTTRFLLKDNKIPGFIGTIRFDTHLSAPMLEIWKILISFSEYSGIGIKTALGMGGMKLNKG